jgi:endonuclease III
MSPLESFAAEATLPGSAVEDFQTRIPRAILMASASRTKQFAELHKVLKRHYKPVKPDSERPVLEHLLLACCLEDAHYEPAEESFAALVHTFFDWNEIRVTSIRELAEALTGLPDRRAAANRLKRVLQSVFEATYAFDLEDRRKKNLGPTIKWLKKLDGTTDFSVAYVVQSALGGHAIPADSGVLRALRLVELISEKDVEAGVVPGLERAIPKAKGIEFGSMLHQLGADFTANPYSPTLHDILLEINPDIADRLPKRRATKSARKKPSIPQPPPAEAPSPPGAQEQVSGGEEAQAAGGDRPERPSSAARKKPGATRKKASSPQEKTAPAGASPEAAPRKKRSASKPITKRKPR